jgi:hypothetical protein
MPSDNKINILHVHNTAIGEIILGAFAQSQRALTAFVMSFRTSACMSAAPTGTNSAKFDIEGENPNMVKTGQKKSGTLRDDLSMFYCCRRQ